MTDPALDFPTVPGIDPALDFTARYGENAPMTEDHALKAWQSLQEIDKAGPEQAEQAAPFRDTLTGYLGRYTQRREKQGQPLFPKNNSRLNQERSDYLRNLYRKSPEDLLSPDKLANYQKTLEMMPDPEAYRIRATNRAYLNTISPQPISPDLYDQVRNQFARDTLGLEGDTSDTAVFNALKSRFQEEQQATESLKPLGTDAFTRGLSGERLSAIDRWELTKSLPERFRQSARDALAEQNQKALDQRRKILPIVKDVVTTLAIRKGATPDDEMMGERIADMVGELAVLPPDDQDLALYLISKEMGNVSLEDLSATERAGEKMLSGARSGFETAYSLFANSLRALQPEEQQRQLDTWTKLRASLDGAASIPESFLPGDSFWQKALIGGSGQVFNFASVLGGGFGLTLLGSSMAGQSYESQRLETPEGNRTLQLGGAAVAGATNVAIESILTRTGLRLLGGKVPGLSRIFARTGVSSPIARSVIAAPVAIAAATATEFAEEIAQDAVDGGISDMVNVLQSLDTKTDWDAFLTRWTTANRTTEEVFYSIFPFALIGAGGVASIQHFKHGEFLRTNAPVMKAIGFRSNKIKEIKESNPQQADRIIKEEMKRITASQQATQAGQPASAVADQGIDRAAVLESVRESARLSREAGLPLLETERNDFTEEDQYILTLPNQQAKTFATEEEAAEAYQDWALEQQSRDSDTVAEAVNNDLISFLTDDAQLAAGTKVEFDDITMDADTAIKRGIATIDQLRARSEIFALQEGSNLGTDFRIMARRFGEVTRQGIYRGTVEYYRGADPINILEDLAETNWDKGLSLGMLDPDFLIGEIRQLEEATGNNYLAEDYHFVDANKMPLLEALSAVSREYFLGNIQNDSIPGTIRRWLQYILAVAGETFRHARSLARSKPLMEAIKSGKVSQKFADQVADSVGLNEVASEARYREAEHQAQLQALNSDLEEISDVLRGRLPHPETMKESPIGPELQIIHDGFVKVGKRRNKKGQRVINKQKADNFFLPRGETASVDGIREEMNERGFDFQTEAEMLEALDDSLFRNFKTYATASLQTSEPSFSIDGNSQSGNSSAIDPNTPGGPQNTPNRRETPDKPHGKEPDAKDLPNEKQARQLFIEATKAGFKLPRNAGNPSAEQIGTYSPDESHLAGIIWRLEGDSEWASPNPTDYGEGLSIIFSWQALNATEKEMSVRAAASLGALSRGVKEPKQYFDPWAGLGKKDFDWLGESRENDARDQYENEILEAKTQIIQTFANTLGKGMIPRGQDLAFVGNPQFMDPEAGGEFGDAIFAAALNDAAIELLQNPDRFESIFDETRQMVRIGQKTSWIETQKEKEGLTGGDLFSQMMGLPPLTPEQEQRIAEIEREADELFKDSPQVSSEETSFSISPAQDVAYLQAVESGDMETAQRMVDEAKSLIIPDTGIEVIPSTNPDQIITRLAEILGESDDRAVGLRSIYESEVGVKDLPNSFYRDENSDILDELSGVSTYRVSPDFEFGFPDFKTEKNWLQKALKESRHAGDQPFLALVAGDLQKDEIFADPHEQVIGSPEVVAYIPRPEAPVTYDSEGNVIPLSQRFDPEQADRLFKDSSPASSGERSFSISPATVARHSELEAKHNAGTITEAETQEAEKLVEEAARIAGLRVLYHGTTQKGRKEIMESGFLRPDAEPAVYLTTAHDGGEYGDGTVIKLAVEESKIEIDDEFPNGREDYRAEIGYGNTLAVKSADPFTGIPLDQRFDPTRDEITYSISPTTVARHTELEAKHDAGTITEEETQEAEKLVEEAARKAGLPVRAYHGSKEKNITTPKANNIWTGRTEIFWLSSEEDTADRYRTQDAQIPYDVNDIEGYYSKMESFGKLYELFLPIPTETLNAEVFKSDQEAEIENQNEEVEGGFEEEIEDWRDVMFSEVEEIIESNPAAIVEIKNFEDNQDSQFMDIGYESVYAVGSEATSRIKSADPFTGVPLDQRFDPTRDEISFSISPRGVQRLERAILEKLNKGPDERVSYASRLIDRLDGLKSKIAEKGQLSEPERLKENIREASAIFTSLPLDARANASFPIARVIEAKTERGRLTVLEDMIDSGNKALERYLKKQYLEQLDKLFDLAKPDLKPNKSLRTRLTPEAQRRASQAYEASILPVSEVLSGLAATDAEISTLERQIDDAISNDADQDTLKDLNDKLDDATRAKMMLETFGAVARQSAAEMAQAYKVLKDIYSGGRAQRRIIDEGRRQQLEEWRGNILNNLGGKPTASEWAKRTTKDGALEKLNAYRMGALSFHQVMEELFPNSKAAREFQDRARMAERATAQDRIEARERFEAFLTRRWQTPSKRKHNKILAGLSERREWTFATSKGARALNIRERSKKERLKLLPEQARAILGGQIKPGWETDPIAMQSLRDALADFDLKRAKDQSRAEFVYFDRTTGRAKADPVIMSELEAVYLLQLAAQEQYLPALDRYGYTEKVISRIRENLSDQSRDIMDFLALEYGSEYPRLNPVFRTLFHMDMPQVRNYAPGKFEHSIFTTEPSADGTEAAQVNAMSAGFTKSREHHTARPQQVNALDVFWGHTEATNYFIHWSELMRDMNAVFKTPDVRRTLEAKYGKRIARNFFNWLDVLNTDARNQSNEESAMRTILSNAQASLSAIGLAFNTGSLLKQVSAGTGAFMEMPTRQAVAGIYRAIQNPSSFKELWNDQIIQQRIKQGMSPEDRALLDAANAKPSQIMRLLEVGRYPLGWTDGLFTTLSAMVAYNYHLADGKQSGLSDERAREHALSVMDRVIIRTAQPATTQDRSLIENTTHGLGKFLLIFRSDPRQKVALAMEALKQRAEGKISTLELARRFFWGWAMYGILAQLATDVWHTMSREEDDDEEWNFEDYLFASVAGPLSGLPIFGAIIETGIRGLINAAGGDLQIFANSTNPLDKAADGILRQRFISALASDEDLAAGELINAALRDTRDIAQILGTLHKSAAIVPVTLRVIKDTTGLIDNILPDSQKETDLKILSALTDTVTEQRDTRIERRDELVEELRDLPEEEREERLAELDKALARSIRRKLETLQMTGIERTLSRLPAEQRAQAIEKMMANRSPQQRQLFRQRLQDLGIITPAVAEWMN